MLAGVQYMPKNIGRIITLCNNIAKAEKLCLRDQVKIYRRRKAVILTEGKTLWTSKRQLPKNQGFVGTLHPYQKKIHNG